MKKSILLFFALASLIGQAQLAVGTTAPNFTATDINGVSHTLYDYTAAGKTVVLNFSATWCGPCWASHNAGNMSNIYNAYGPNGSDQVVVIFIESSTATNVNSLNGTGQNTLGNWVDQTPYPIIKNNGLGGTYSIGFFPTYYVVCPDNRITYASSNGGASTVRGRITSAPTTGCGVALNDMLNHGSIKTNKYYPCNSDNVSISATFTNQGSNQVTSVNASLVSGGNVLATQDFPMTRNRWQTQVLNFNPLSIPDPNIPLNVVVNSINGVTPHSPSILTKPTSVNISNTTHQNITIKITLDRYGSETSWSLRNSSDVVVASSPAYTDAATAGSYPQADVNLTLPYDCYRFTINDSFGDGMMQSGFGGYQILANGVLIPNMSGGAFGSTETKFFNVNDPLSSNEFQTNNITLFPNPASDNFTINTTKLVNVEIVNMLGKLVKSVQNVDASTSVDVSNLDAGVYFVKVLGENAAETIKLIKK